MSRRLSVSQNWVDVLSQYSHNVDQAFLTTLVASSMKNMFLRAERTEEKNVVKTCAPLPPAQQLFMCLEALSHQWQSCSQFWKPYDSDLWLQMFMCGCLLMCCRWFCASLQWEVNWGSAAGSFLPSSTAPQSSGSTSGHRRRWSLWASSSCKGWRLMRWELLLFYRWLYRGTGLSQCDVIYRKWLSGSNQIVNSVAFFFWR